MSLGLLDLANPLLSRLDAVLALALPAIPRIVLISALLTYLGMCLYRQVSAQKRLRALKRLAKRAEKAPARSGYRVQRVAEARQAQHRLAVRDREPHFPALAARHAAIAVCAERPVAAL